jgi:hypothetical protein
MSKTAFAAALVVAFCGLALRHAGTVLFMPHAVFAKSFTKDPEKHWCVLRNGRRVAIELMLLERQALYWVTAAW